MNDKPSNVIPFPAPAPFVLELRSERFVDLLHALTSAGFDVTYIRGSVNRYRIDDQQEVILL